jgi:phosphate/sulfate permease
MGTRPYVEILILGFITSFYTACGIGANDAANSFATSVGARVLTLKQAIVIAGICEFLGAVLLGSHVTDTIRKKIVSPKAFEDSPYKLMYGMFAASFATGIWLMIATYMKWPVSTTHSTVGAVIGFAIVHDSDSINQKKLGDIFLSWVISPLAALIMTMILLSLNIIIVFHRKHPEKWAPYWMPFMIAITIWLVTMFVIYKGTPELELDDQLDFKEALWISAVIGAGIGFISFLSFRFGIFSKLGQLIVDNFPKTIEWYRKHFPSAMEQHLDNIAAANATTTTEKSATQELEMDLLDKDIKPSDSISNNGEANDTNEADVENADTQSIHSKVSRASSKYGSEKFTEMKLYDEDIEDLYSWLQVFTAVISSFAHGSNDVANSIGPLAAMYSIYNNGTLEKKSDVPVWILVIGGVGIVVGLANWGWRVIDRMGKELSGVTPTRGVSIELGAAVAVLWASRLEFPVSTTHCQVGSLVGSGLIDSFRTNGCSGLISNKLPNIDLWVFAKIVFSWVITLPVTIGISAFIYYLGLRIHFDN